MRFYILALFVAFLAGCANLNNIGPFQKIDEKYAKTPELKIDASCRFFVPRVYGWGEPIFSDDCNNAAARQRIHTAYLEYGEDGKRLDPLQWNAIERWLKRSDSPSFILVYVHGWHHSAHPDSGNYQAFPQMTAKFADHLQRMYLANGLINVPQVLGIYIGWPGKSSGSMFSIASRARVADTVARAGELKEDLENIQRLNRARTHGRLGGSMLVMGNSLGGRLLHQAYLPDLERGDSRPLKERTLIVTLQAAISADYLAQTMARQTATPRAPHWINVGSTDDEALAGPFSLAARLGLIPVKIPGSTGSLTAISKFPFYPTHRLEVDHSDVACPAPGSKFKTCVKIKTIEDVKAFIPSDMFTPPIVEKDRKVEVLFPGMKILSDGGQMMLVAEDGRLDGRLYEADVRYIRNPPLQGRLWHISTNKDVIFSTDVGRKNAEHNGIISTMIAKMALEALWQLNTED